MDYRQSSDSLSIRTVAFDDLDLRTLYDILALRMAVFCVEQNCPYQDLDGKDDLAWHVLVHSAGDLVATARILMPGQAYSDACSIGRVANHGNARGQGVGVKLMHEAVSACERLFPQYPIRIGAQHYLEAFYQRFGFETSGPTYLEDGIIHVPMVKAAIA